MMVDRNGAPVSVGDRVRFRPTRRDNGLWLTGVMQAADHARVGILPDFGNFYTDRVKGELYNPYKGLREFMPWVKKGMSAKAYDWDTGAGKFYTEDRREGREIDEQVDLRLLRAEAERIDHVEGIERAEAFDIGQF